MKKVKKWMLTQKDRKSKDQLKKWIIYFLNVYKKGMMNSELKVN